MIILGLGSNVGDRLANLENAIHNLSESTINITAISPIYESSAMLKPNAPKGWDVPYLNMAIMGETHLAPQALLTQVKCVEKKMGRQDRGIWAPREIDIDILAYDDLFVNESNLQIPHSSLCKRPFALLPLADISPNWRFPQHGEYAGKTAHEIVSLLPENITAKKTDFKLKLKKTHMVA